MAVVTPANVRDAGWLPGLSGTGADTLLTTLIATAEDALARYCGHQPATATGAAAFDDAEYTLYLDGPGGDSLRLPFGPLVSVSALYDDPNRAYGAATAVDSGDYEVIGDEARLLRYAGAWSTSERSIKITATLGYTSVPQAIKDAVGLTVGHWYKVRDRLGNESVSQGGTSVTLRPEGIPEAARQMVAPYRWLRGGWA